MPLIYLGNCYSSCILGEYYDEIEKIYKCKCFDERCFICSEESLKLGLCHTCNDGYYPKIDDQNIDIRYINCYRDPEDYYLDKQNGIYKYCYESCKYCTQIGNVTHNYCTMCKIKYSYSLPMESNETLINCYPDCLYNFYLNDNNEYICLKAKGCPEESKILIDGKKLCVKSCKGHKNK